MRPCYAESSNRKTRADMAEKERIPISAIVPCYNEAGLIETCYREISRVLVENFDDGHEILFVDDGSDDATLGLFCIAVGVLLLIWMLVSVLSPAIQPASGWSSIITAVVFFSGVQLLTLGVIGGYIGNIFDEVKRRPEYIVKRYINFGDG